MIYVTSDLHGSFKEFKELLKLINFNDDDYMYILGDVIDRGDEPIELIRYIMNSPNIELLMGNHEYMAMIILKLLIREIDNDKTVDEVLTPDFYENYNIWVNYNGGVTTLKQLIIVNSKKTSSIFLAVFHYMRHSKLMIIYIFSLILLVIITLIKIKILMSIPLTIF